jgi:hypothetical protein
MRWPRLAHRHSACDDAPGAGIRATIENNHGRTHPRRKKNRTRTAR